MDLIHEKYNRLESRLNQLGTVAVAFSAGVDSTFLLKAAHDVLGSCAFAITVKTASVPQREVQEAMDFCKKEGIEHIILDIDQLGIDGFCENTKERCYICKKAIFTQIKAAADKRGAKVIDGTNADDTGDFRPGMAALSELSVESPLRDAELTKADIRTLSHELGLPTADKPSYACLSTRIAYGDVITEEKLRMTEQAEEYLRSLGFTQLRVRMHGNIARIELVKSEIPLVDDKTRESISKELHDLGYAYVTLDMDGFVSGSMNS